MPAWNFRIEDVSKVTLQEASLKEISPNLWAFNGTAQILTTDNRRTAQVRQSASFTGNANITSYTGKGTTEELPKTKLATITQLRVQPLN